MNDIARIFSGSNSDLFWRVVRSFCLLSVVV
jgi:hypothetical protein